MRTRPFLRTLEFLWQEGHTCHAAKEEADEMVEAALKMYADFDREALALPVLTGRKPEHEKFAGALYTLTTEALARDGKAIQAGTSHNLGQGFSKAYGVSFLDVGGTRQLPWMTSWGVSTRLIGTLIIVHGDERGLRLPPSLAPIQIVLIPIYKTDAERMAVMKACRTLAAKLADLRVMVDEREERSPGFKFNEWEVKGVPVRVEIGPRDLKTAQVVVIRRDTSAKEPWPIRKCTADAFRRLLKLVQAGLFSQAERFLTDHTSEAKTYEELKERIEGEGGVVWAPWDGMLSTAEAVQEETKASIRLLDTDVARVKGRKDLKSGAPARSMALFAKAY
jgi:prolyl-tRNA synthetase